jgi:hypothetical protein
MLKSAGERYMKSDSLNCVIHNVISAFTDNEPASEHVISMLTKLHTSIDPVELANYRTQSVDIIARVGKLDATNKTLWLNCYDMFIPRILNELETDNLTNANHYVLEMMDWLETNTKGVNNG